MSLICSFPSEILSEIFAYVVFDPLDPANPVSMEQSLADIWSSLYNLISVCSVWRNVALSHGSLWSIIPFVIPKTGSSTSNRVRQTQLCLERAGSGGLHLAAIISERQAFTDLANHAPRFRSINILAVVDFAMRSFMEGFLRSDYPLQVSDLSICLKSYEPLHRPPIAYHYLFPRDSPEQKALENIMRSLSKLHISGTMIYWDRMIFSHRLVEVELKNLTLGYDPKLSELIASLSSADELRSLKVISIRTFPLLALENTTVTPDVLFPKLETLLAQDLRFNTLDALLSSIASRTHHLTVHLTSRILGTARQSVVSFQDISNLFRRVTVDTLSMEAPNRSHWLSDESFREFLEAMPDLKTLRMHNWNYDLSFCNVIRQPGTPSFPQLERVYLTGASVQNEEAFKIMVASHSNSLKYMELAGEIFEDDDMLYDRRFLTAGEEIVTWLEKNVPNFKLTSNRDVPPEFRDPVWQLW